MLWGKITTFSISITMILICEIIVYFQSQICWLMMNHIKNIILKNWIVLPFISSADHFDPRRPPAAPPARGPQSFHRAANELQWADGQVVNPCDVIPPPHLNSFFRQQLKRKIVLKLRNPKVVSFVSSCHFGLFLQRAIKFLFAFALWTWKSGMKKKTDSYLYESRLFARNLIKTQTKLFQLLNIAINTAWLRNWLRTCLLYTVSFYYQASLSKHCL